MNAINQSSVLQLGKHARKAQQQLSLASADQKNAALLAMAKAIRDQGAVILQANARDVSAAKDKQPDAFIDRLTLNDARIDSMASSIESIAQLADPVGRVLAKIDRPNGLHIERVSVPLGVIAVIYEARPNVTADAAALCLKSGNAVILRGGSECFASAQAILSCIHQGLIAAKLATDCVQMVATPDRAALTELIKLNDYIDVIVPRGGANLIEFITANSSIALFKHLDGICHTYVHSAADAAMTMSVVVNAKMRRTGICGATETLLVDNAIAKIILPKLLSALMSEGCEIRGDAAVQQLVNGVVLATDADFGHEFLAPILAVKIVSDIDEAIAHINSFSSAHTDAIITSDQTAAEKFLREVNSAIVMHNASTQFADGGEFGMGAEIGIATGKLHARGPVGVEQLTTFKYQVRGSGQIRPR